MTIKELMELLAEYPPDYTVTINDDYTRLDSVECGRDFVGRKNVIILCEE